MRLKRIFKIRLFAIESKLIDGFKPKALSYKAKKFIFAAIPRHCHNTFSVSMSGVVTPKICRKYPFVETFLPTISLKSFDARL